MDWRMGLAVAAAVVAGCGPVGPAAPGRTDVSRPASGSRDGESPQFGGGTLQASSARNSEHAGDAGTAADTEDTVDVVDAGGSAGARDETGAQVERASESGAGRERFVLFTSGGPLIVELRLTINGCPHTEALDRLVTDVLRQADPDGDGRVTWAELTKMPLLASGQLGNLTPDNDSERQRLIRTYDSDRDGEVGAEELPRYLTRNRGKSRPFSLTSSNYFRGFNRHESPLRRLLDTNADGLLSRDEMQAGAERIAGRDPNDDRLIAPGDLSTERTESEAALPRRRRRGPGAAAEISDLSDWNELLDAWQDLYAMDGQLGRQSFPLVPSLLDALDANGDAQLDAEEVSRLTEQEAHIVLGAHFGLRGDGQPPQPTLELLAVRPELESVSHSIYLAANAVVLEFPGVEIEAFVKDLAPGLDYQEAADAQIQQFDTNQDGYVDVDEAAAEEGGALASFAAVDGDGNGKVYAAELVVYLNRRDAVVRGQIVAHAADTPDALFSCLDTDSDGQLSPREIAGGVQRLMALDRDGDGQVHFAEIPGSMAVVIARGGSELGEQLYDRPAPVTVHSGTPAPAWFAAMDTNSDGDLDREEFLGTPEEFATLDGNGDGFLTVEEAVR